jgi:hypothetical protein
MNAHREIYPVAQPDPDDLERFMFERDAPYEHQRTTDGGLEIRASGRSALVLYDWLAAFLDLSPIRL